MSGKQPGRWAAVRGFLATGLWELRLEPLPAWKRAGVRVLRVLTLAVRESVKDECGLRAASLTFYTLLSVVPVLGVAFGIAKGFGLEKLLEEQLLAQMSGQEQALERILGFARNMLEDARGGLIAGIGVALMIWAAVKILGQIEAALNAMWDGLPPRPWGRRFGDYLAVLLIAPILMLSASGANVFIRTGLDEVAGRLGLLDAAGPLIVQLLRLTPVLLAWALFTMMYAMMPNTRVRLLPALAGGALGGSLYHLVQWVYIAFQVGAAKQNAIYGSFAALPLCLAWVLTSGMIFLFGAQSRSARSVARGGTLCPGRAAADRRGACPCDRGPAGRGRGELGAADAGRAAGAGGFARGGGGPARRGPGPAHPPAGVGRAAGERPARPGLAPGGYRPFAGCPCGVEAGGGGIAGQPAAGRDPVNAPSPFPLPHGRGEGCPMVVHAMEGCTAQNVALSSSNGERGKS